MTPSISIIVAVHNAEKTLARCLDSILAQQFHNFEIVCVNDGSKDNSWDVLRKYAEKDQRIRIFTQDNHGVAFTRQKGHDLACGKYIIHIDADDWVDPDFLQILFDTAESSAADITICGLTTHYAEGVIESAFRPNELSPSSVAGALLDGMHGSLCNKLILRKIIVDNDIRFLEGVNCWEDLYLNLRILAIDVIIAYAETTGYHYDKTGSPESITNNWFTVPIKNRLSFIEAVDGFLRPDNRPEFARFVSLFAYDSLFYEKRFCPDYSGSFRKYKKIIAGADLPTYKKGLVLLRIYHIPIPIRILRAFKRKLWNNV